MTSNKKTITKLAVVVRTNVPKTTIQKKFLSELSVHLAEKYQTEPESHPWCRQKMKGSCDGDITHEACLLMTPRGALAVKKAKCLLRHIMNKIQNVVLEIHCDVMMMRGGLTSPMLNMNIHHNCDKINQRSKHEDAGFIAKFINDSVGIPVERVLVLFFDTNKCT